MSLPIRALLIFLYVHNLKQVQISFQLFSLQQKNKVGSHGKVRFMSNYSLFLHYLNLFQLDIVFSKWMPAACNIYVEFDFNTILEYVNKS